MKTDTAFLNGFVTWVENRSFSYSCPLDKNRLHTDGKKVLKILAKKLYLQPGDYEIRSNKGGIAVAGEITLHANTIYIQIQDSFLGEGLQIMFRRTNGRKDFVGQVNTFASLHALLDVDQLCERMRRVSGVLSLRACS